MMLVFSRRPGEKVHVAIGDRIVTVQLIRVDNKLKLGFDAPPEAKILRGELVGPDETVEQAMRRGRE